MADPIVSEVEDGKTVKYYKVRVVDGDTISGIGARYGRSYKQSVDYYCNLAINGKSDKNGVRDSRSTDEHHIYPGKDFYIPLSDSKGKKKQVVKRTIEANTAVRCFYKDAPLEPIKYGHVLYWFYNRDESDILKDSNDKPIIKIGRTDAFGFLKPIKSEFKIEQRTINSEKESERSNKNYNRYWFKNEYQKQGKTRKGIYKVVNADSWDYVWSDDFNCFPTHLKIGFLIFPVDTIGRFKTNDLFNIGNDDNYNVVNKIVLNDLNKEEPFQRKVFTKFYARNSSCRYKTPKRGSAIRFVSIEKDKSADRDKNKMIEEITNYRNVYIHSTLPEWIRRIYYEKNKAKQVFNKYKRTTSKYLKGVEFLSKMGNFSDLAVKYPYRTHNDNESRKDTLRSIIIQEKIYDITEKVTKALKEDNDATNIHIEFQGKATFLNEFLKDVDFSKEFVNYLNYFHSEFQREASVYICKDDIFDELSHNDRIKNLLCLELEEAFKIIKYSDINHQSGNDNDIVKTPAYSAFEELHKVVKKNCSPIPEDHQAIIPFFVSSILLDDFLSANRKYVISGVTNFPGTPSFLIIMLDTFAPYISSAILKDKLGSSGHRMYKKAMSLFLDVFVDESKRRIVERELRIFLENGIFREANESFSKLLLKSTNWSKNANGFGSVFKAVMTFFSVLMTSKSWCNEDEEWTLLKGLTFGNECTNMLLTLCWWGDGGGVETQGTFFKTFFKSGYNSTRVQTRFLGVVGGLLSSVIAIVEYKNAIERGDIKKGRFELLVKDLIFAGLGIICFFTAGFWISVIYAVFLVCDYFYNKWLEGGKIENFLYESFLNYRNGRNFIELETVDGFKQNIDDIIKLSDDLDTVVGLSWRAVFPLINMGYVVYKKGSKEIDIVKTSDLIGNLVDVYSKIKPNRLILKHYINNYHKESEKLSLPQIDRNISESHESSIYFIVKHYVKLQNRLQSVRINESLRDKINKEVEEYEKWQNGSIDLDLIPKYRVIEVDGETISLNGKILKADRNKYEVYDYTTE